LTRSHTLVAILTYENLKELWLSKYSPRGLIELKVQANYPIFSVLSEMIRFRLKNYAEIREYEGGQLI